MDIIKHQTKLLAEKSTLNYKIPGLLIIDTPGHESFTNLRSRGSNLCDVAILIVDILHGLENQTIESINLLKKRKVPFIVALNKVDTCYDWKGYPNYPIRNSLKLQKKATVTHFEEMLKKTKLYFQEQGINSEIYYKNTNFKDVLSIVPTSAFTGFIKKKKIKKN
jgi:translation initiation factor 5B